MQNSFRVLDVTLLFLKSGRLLDRSLAGQACVAFTRIRVDRRGWHENGFRIGRATAFPRALSGTPGAMSMLRDCAKSLLPDSRPSR